jgi:hypothetical protein
VKNLRFHPEAQIEMAASCLHSHYHKERGDQTAYTVNSLIKGWWEKVTVIIWGATAKLVSQDENIQEMVRKALEAGVQITACKACADQFGVTETLENLNIEVKYWGEPFTEILKNDEKLLTI